MTGPIAFQFGPFRLDPFRRLLLRQDEPVSLTPKAFDALLFLVASRDRVVTKQELLDALWPGVAVEDATVSQHVFMVRRALNGAGNDDSEYIATVPRRGYRFVATVTEVTSQGGNAPDVMPDVLPPVAAGQGSRVSPSIRVGAAIASVLFVVGAAAVGVLVRSVRPPAAARVVHLTYLIPDGQQMTRPARGVAALSPDGTTLVYAANRQLYARRLSEDQSRPVAGTNLDVCSPFFSPDGQWIGFWSAQDSTLKKIPVGGGTPVTIGPASNPRGASWFGDLIVVADGEKGIIAMPATGGRPERWVEAGQDELILSPHILPGGDAVMYTAAKVTGNQVEKNKLVAYSRRMGTTKVLINDGGDARFVGTGRLVYAIGSSLFAVPFDSRRLQISGPPVPIVERVLQPVGGVANFDVSADGTLIYVLADSMETRVERQLALVDRHGRSQVIGAAGTNLSEPRLAPDGNRIAVTTDDDDGTIWIDDLSHSHSLRRLTFKRGSRFPVWSPDGRRVAYGATVEDGAGILVQAADGSGVAERLTTAQPGFVHVPASWSFDGSLLLFANVKAGVKDTIWSVSLVGDRKLERVLALPGSNQMDPRLSPNGHWIAYSSEGEAGRSTLQVFVQPFPPTGARYQISQSGGDMPAWSGDGARLFYRTPSNRGLAFVSVATHPSFSVGDAVTLPIDGLLSDAGYDVLPDGRFVVPVAASRSGLSTARPIQQIGVLLNWFEDGKRLARASQ